MKFLILSALVATALAWDNDCGRTKHGAIPHIVGGQEARPGQFPWQVSVTDNQGRHFCGGVVAARNFILTAAHCVEGRNPQNTYAVVGEHDRRETGEPNRRSLQVQEIWVHEWYDITAAFDADIALMRVERMEWSDEVTPACRPDDDDLYVGQNCQVSGWGTTVSGGGSLPPILRWVEMPIQSNADCYDSMWPSDITDGMICAGDIPEYERDSCQGDSGGPLVVQKGGQWQVVGLVSWGFGCASGTPGVYARVSEYNDWLEATMAL